MIVAALVTAQVASAQTSTVVASAYTYSGVMKVGMKGPGISTLQAALNTVNGVNATIVVDGSFGPATLLAVKQFQASHGLVADGVVGPMTGGKLALASVAVITVPTGTFPAGCTSAAGYSITTGMKCSASGSFPAGCTSAAGYSPTTGMKCDATSSSSNNGSLSGGETSLDSVKVTSADDTSVKESASKTEVAKIKFTVKDADAELTRADLVFDGTGNDEDRPWNVFDKIYLMDGSKVLASMDSGSKSDWDETNASGVYRIRMTGLDAIFAEGDHAELSVAADIASSVDGSDTAGHADWNVSIDDDSSSTGLRFTDGAGVDTVENGTGSADFSIEQSGTNSDLTITQDSSSPDAGTLQVDSTSSTTATIAVFKVKADQDGGDVKIDDFPVRLTTTTSNNSVVVDDVYLVINGKTYTTDTTPTAALTTDYHFTDIEDDDVVISAGDTMKVTVKVKFKSESSGPYSDGVTIKATPVTVSGDFEDADTGDDIGSVSNGSASEIQQLYADGVQVSDFSSTVDTIADSGSTTTANYTVTFKVTAFGNTFYIPKTVTRSATATSAGLDYVVEDETGATTTLAGASASMLTSSANTVGSAFEVAEGDTETFTAHITVTKGSDAVPNYYNAQLTYFGYDDDSALGSVSNIQLLPAQDYQTDQVLIQA